MNCIHNLIDFKKLQRGQLESIEVAWSPKQRDIMPNGYFKKVVKINS